MSKYHNIKTLVDGRMFSSKAEAARYRELRLMEKAGQIADLVCQPPYPCYIGDKLICTYIADFKYTTFPNQPDLGREVVEDVKGMKTPTYNLKKKLVRALHGIEIFESGLRKKAGRFSRTKKN